MEKTFPSSYCLVTVMVTKSSSSPFSLFNRISPIEMSGPFSLEKGTVSSLKRKPSSVTFKVLHQQFSSLEKKLLLYSRSTWNQSLVLQPQLKQQ